MPAPWSSRRSSLALVSTAAVFWVSCASPPREVAETTPNPVVESAPVANTVQPSPPASPQRSQTFFRDGVNRAQSAVAIGQSAQSPDDWNLAASRWQQASQLMQQVPSSDPNYAVAQQKVQEYQQNAVSAQQRAKGGGLPSPGSPPKNSRADGKVAQIPILERQGGTPVVPVVLTGNNGKQSFPMLFDTGASLTLITPAMANAIGVVVVNEITVGVADGRQVQLPIGYIDTLEVGGLVLKDVLVAIGGDVGLLGQDVYGQYGISAGANVINLYE
jgi:predicted aspartyl protease